jgi:DNA uptake protein ComE-like DNA-binding protein
MRALKLSVAMMVAIVGAPCSIALAMAQDTPSAAKPAPPAATNGSFSSSTNTAGPIAPDKSHPLDLNAASQAELTALPGISADRSKAIVEGRPYKATYDLVKRNILTEEAYSRIKDLINVKKG